MYYLSEQTIPEKTGSVFLVGSGFPQNYQIVLEALSNIDGVQQLQINARRYPYEITVYTQHTVTVKEVQVKAKEVGFHAIPKSFLLQ